MVVSLQHPWLALFQSRHSVPMPEVPHAAGLLPAALAVITAAGMVYRGIVHAAKIAAENIVQEYVAGIWDSLGSGQTAELGWLGTSLNRTISFDMLTCFFGLHSFHSASSDCDRSDGRTKLIQIDSTSRSSNDNV